jgi:demethylmenaquinone methyltransferase / 2-methoxy-6-polyprenyl-1,4-benzoquinol methylase
MTSTAPDRTGSVLPSADEKRAVVAAMFDRIAGSYERVNHVISLGLDNRWRRRAVEALGVAPGSLVLDLACGTGDMSRMLRAKGHSAVGVDFSMNMLRHAHGPSSLVRADVSLLPLADGSADGITCGFALRNLVDIATFFSECTRVLRAGGRVAVLDAATPRNALARAGHRLWFGHMVPWIGGRMSERAAYRYLSASTVYLPDPASLTSTATEAGFTDVDVMELTMGAVRLLTATKP